MQQCYSGVQKLLLFLNLEKYLDNFVKAEITDAVLLLINENSLKEIDIPVGPRLLILHTIRMWQEKANFSRDMCTNSALTPPSPPLNSPAISPPTRTPTPPISSDIDIIDNSNTSSPSSFMTGQLHILQNRDFNFVETKHELSPTPTLTHSPKTSVQGVNNYCLSSLFAQQYTPSITIIENDRDSSSLQAPPTKKLRVDTYNGAVPLQNDLKEEKSLSKKRKLCEKKVQTEFKLYTSPLNEAQLNKKNASGRSCQYHYDKKATCDNYCIGHYYFPRGEPIPDNFWQFAKGNHIEQHVKAFRRFKESRPDLFGSPRIKVGPFCDPIEDTAVLISQPLPSIRPYTSHNVAPENKLTPFSQFYKSLNLPATNSFTTDSVLGEITQ